jgi:hypothetical protein
MAQLDLGRPGTFKYRRSAKRSRREGDVSVFYDDYRHLRIILQNISFCSRGGLDNGN